MPTRNVVLRPAAEDDLTGIYRYIAACSGYPEQAIGYIRRIRAFCDTLATFPERGQRRDDLRPGLLVIGKRSGYGNRNYAAACDSRSLAGSREGAGSPRRAAS